MDPTISRRMRDYRARLREKGLAPLTIWLPKRHHDAVRQFAKELPNDPEIAPERIAAMIAEMREGGMRWAEIATALNTRGIATLSGATWTEGNVQVFARRQGARTETNSPR